MGRHRVPVVANEAVAASEDRTAGTELVLRTPQQPILCTAFSGSVALGAVKQIV